MLNKLLDIDELDESNLKDLKRRRKLSKQIKDESMFLTVLSMVGGGKMRSAQECQAEATKKALVKSLFESKSGVMFVDYQTMQTSRRLIQSQGRKPNDSAKINGRGFKMLQEIESDLLQSNVNSLYEEWLRIYKSKGRKKVRIEER